LKKITIKCSKKTAIKVKKELDEQLLEATLLKKMNSDTIVNYINSWIEVELREVRVEETFDNDEIEFNYDDCISFKSNAYGEDNLSEDEDESSICFEKKKFNGKFLKTHLSKDENFVINGKNYK
jgi:hypothetical protein